MTIAGATDNAGNEMASSYSYTFKTGKAAEVSPGTASNICIRETTGTTISDIVISENLADNFFNAGDGLQHSLRLDLPDGFEFI